jgi:putative ABC transport system permease protein
LYPVFIDLASRTIELNLWNNPVKLLIVFSGSIVIGFISGIYPSLLFSSFNTVNTIKGRLNPGTGVSRMRSVLVVFQFSITIILVASTIIIYNQLDYIKNKDLGYKDEQILVIEEISSLGQQTESFKNELLKNRNVVSASVSRSLPGRNLSATIFKCEEHDINMNYAFALFPTDYDFVNTFGTRIIAGRYFSEEYSTDTNSVVLNETAVKELGLSDPVGKQILNPEDEAGEYQRLTIIGVMNDFHLETLHGEMLPVVFSRISQDDKKFISIKLKAGDPKESIEAIETLWAEFSPDKPFEYFFLDEDFDKYYEEDIKTSKLFSAFSVLAIFIACLGLLGLISYTAERRTKEIGIRKTLGASLASILIMLSKEFTIWIIIANVIAIPVAYYFMSGWLEEFAYRISINPLTFIIAGIATILIALITAAYQTLKAALSNPVNSLRDE